MKRNYLKKNIVWTLLVFIIITGMSWEGVVYAAEHEEVSSPAMSEAEETTALTVELTEEERQEKLAQIAQQLKEVERALIHLSLRVTKLALEEQALALQQQLAKARTETVPEGEIAIAASEQSQPEASAGGGSAFGGGPPPAEAAREEDVFGALSLEDQEEISLESLSLLNQDEDEERSGGFLAALGPLGNLGTPELAALAILAMLGLFILVRRFRERKKPHPVQNVPMKVPEEQPEPSPQSQGSVFQ